MSIHKWQIFVKYTCRGKSASYKYLCTEKERLAWGICSCFWWTRTRPVPRRWTLWRLSRPALRTVTAAVGRLPSLSVCLYIQSLRSQYLHRRSPDSECTLKTCRSNYSSGMTTFRQPQLRYEAKLYNAQNTNRLPARRFLLDPKQVEITGQITAQRICDC